ncbi:MAG TPA: glycosyltransferase family 39 protein [Acidimicrobiales bacterium]|nr:glycosyltransferase family 39 protein [Acidimicrobiales bacterium]
MAAGFVLVATRRGIGLSPDSIEYLGVARNLLKGHGLTVPFGSVGEEPFAGAPMTSFPPLYPVLLAVGGAGLVWARVLAVLCMAVTAGSVMLIARRYVDGATAACVTALLLAPDMMRVHAEAWSEPVLLAVVAVGALALLSHLDRPRPGTRFAVLAACALAPMARYAGVAFVVAAAVVLAKRRRWRDSLAAVGAGMVPLTAWLVYGAAAVTDPGSTGRTIAWHPPPWDALFDQTARTTGTWWFSGFGPSVGVAVIVLLALAVRVRWNDHLLLPLALAGSTVVLLLATWTLLDRTTVFDARLLVSTHLAVIVALALLVPRRWQWDRQALALGAAAVLVALGGFRYTTRFPASRSFQYASAAWVRSPTLKAAAGLSLGRPVYSNSPEIVWWTTGRSAELLPVKAGLRSGAPQPWRLRVSGLPAGSLLVFFDGAARAYEPTPADIESVRPLRLKQRLADGAIYEL